MPSASCVTGSGSSRKQQKGSSVKCKLPILIAALVLVLSCSVGATASSGTHQAITWERHAIKTNRHAARSCQEARFIRRSPADHAERSTRIPYLDSIRVMWKMRHIICKRKLRVDQRRWRADPVAHAKHVARWLLARHGLSSEFWALDYIIMHESSYHVHADNPTSDAYGIPQALPGSKMASYGSDWRTNPVTQLHWMIHYCINKYGSITNAYYVKIRTGVY